MPRDPTDTRGWAWLPVDAEQLGVGHAFHLKSGSPPMTVTAIHADGTRSTACVTRELPREAPPPINALLIAAPHA